jgi:hypothetical protein
MPLRRRFPSGLAGERASAAQAVYIPAVARIWHRRTLAAIARRSHSTSGRKALLLGRHSRTPSLRQIGISGFHIGG